MKVSLVKRKRLKRFVEQLSKSQIRIVLAESCTSGLVSALMGQIPGVSNVLCGSMVVYRSATKSDWLELDPKMLADPSRGTVCSETTRQLALAVLQATPEAAWSLAITGHFGPDAPAELEGTIFIATSTRLDSQAMIADEVVRKLQSQTPADSTDFAARANRQIEAAWMALDVFEQSIKRFSPR